MLHFSPTHDYSCADRTVGHSRISGAAALCCSGFTRAQGIMGEGRRPRAKPSRQIHRPAIRRADYRESRGTTTYSSLHYNYISVKFQSCASALIVFFTQPGDAGVFTCVATNAAGSVRQDVRLSINMRPAFKELPGDVTLNKGQSLALSCHAQGTPSPVISWTFNNSPYPGIFCITR